MEFNQSINKLLRNISMIIDILIIVFIVFGGIACWGLSDYVKDLSDGIEEKFWGDHSGFLYIGVCSSLSIIIILGWWAYVIEANKYEKVKEYEIQGHMEKHGDHFVVDMKGDTNKVIEGDIDCDTIEYEYTKEEQKVVIKQNEYKDIRGCKKVIIYVND